MFRIAGTIPSFVLRVVFDNILYRRLIIKIRGYMSKKRKFEKQVQPITSINVSLPSGIGAEEMQHIIAKAVVEADEIREQKKKEQQEKELRKWRATIGYREYSDKNILIKTIRKSINEMGCICRIMFLPAKRITGDRASLGLIQMFLNVCFGIAQLITSVVFVVLFFGGIVSFFTPSNMPFPLMRRIGAICLGIGCFFFSRMFRMASVETQKIEDRNLLFGLFASVTSIISILIAVFALIK